MTDEPKMPVVGQHVKYSVEGLMYVLIRWVDRYAHLENKPFTDRDGNMWRLLESPQFVRAGGHAYVRAVPA